MNVVITFFFYIFAVNQGNAYNLTVHLVRLQGNSYLPVSVDLLDNSDDNYDGFSTEDRKYEITFNRDVDEENDMPLVFTYYNMQGQPLNGRPSSIKDAKLCQSNHDTIEGTTAAMAARVLGIEKDPPCPIKKGTKNIQNEFFVVDSDDYHMMLFDPLIGYFEGALTVTSDNYQLFDIITTVVDD